jgi:glycosyltransferase involved in cell wall biosynthesis
MKKILLITEYLDPPYDEGIKKTVYNLFNQLNKKYNLKVICRYGFEHENIDIVKANALFFSRKIYNKISKFKPDVLIYFPFASATFAGYLRVVILNCFSRKSKHLFIALQPKPLKIWQKLIVRLVKPQSALTPSPALKGFWDSIGVQNEILPLHTDLSIFQPATNEKKKKIRKKYNISRDAFIISHIGHLNEGRNLKSLITLQETGNQLIVVSSSSTPSDALGPSALKGELETAGIKVFDGYIEDISEIYHMSDVYIFPVMEPNSSIGMPLSILEARACGIPVITTEFGSVKDFIGFDYGGVFYSNPEEFLITLNRVKELKNKIFLKSKIQKLNNRFLYVVFNIINKSFYGEK